MDFMGNSPYDFVMNAKESDFKSIEDKAVHRTFNGEDLKQFVFNLQRLYQEQESLSYFSGQKMMNKISIMLWNVSGQHSLIKIITVLTSM